MQQPQSQTFGAGMHLYIIIGIFAAIFSGLGIAIGVTRNEWIVLAVIAGVTVVMFLLLQILRLEIGSTSFRYRNLTGSRVVHFENISRAFFEVVESDSSPRPAVAFNVEQKSGKRVKVNLRTFPIRAAAELFTALEGHGITIEVSNNPAAQQVADEVKAAQAKLVGKS